MKQLCVAAAGLAALSVSSVSAADLAAHAPAPAPVVAPATSWSGFYLGAQGGGGWGTSNETYLGAPNDAAFIGTQSYNTSGGFVGGVVGYNFQTGPVVFGIEGDYHWAAVTGRSDVINVGPPSVLDTYYTELRSFVNIIATPKGGTHVAGFEQALLKVFRKQLEVNARKLKVGNDKVDKDDVLAGMTAVVTVRLAEPQFEGQTKEVLGTNAVRQIVSKVVETELTSQLTSTKRGDKQMATQLLEKVVAEMKSRISARLHKETQRRKNALETSSLPPKLRDCRSSDVEATELFIVEGDSAMGTAKEARNSEFQALLPIRGKILNVQKAAVGDMLKNAECASIIQVVGAGSGKSFDLDQARYGKVIFMADADSDGAHIRCLLATLFFRYMRPMVEAGRVFSAVPPLHRFELINPKRGMDKYLYTYTDADYQRTAAQLAKKGVRFKEPQRYKGLGEMDASQLKETTMDPRHRTLRRITVDDAAEAEGTFEILMGNEVAPRKQFIVEGAYRLDAEQIDA